MTPTANHSTANLTATPAARDFAADARRPRDILVETRANGDPSATAAIASISDQDWHISRTHGVYHIPARAPGEPYALVVITSRGDALDLGDNRRFPFTISARDIAADVLQDLHKRGIFICAGERPSAEELASATARRDAYYHQLISDGLHVLKRASLSAKSRLSGTKTRAEWLHTNALALGIRLFVNAAAFSYWIAHPAAASHLVSSAGFPMNLTLEPSHATAAMFGLSGDSLMDWAAAKIPALQKEILVVEQRRLQFIRRLLAGLPRRHAGLLHKLQRRKIPNAWRKPRERSFVPPASLPALLPCRWY